MTDFWAADPVVPNAPSGGNFWDADPVAQPKSGLADFFQSIPRGMLSGFSNAASAVGQAANADNVVLTPEGVRLPEAIPSGPQTTDILEKNVTGPLPQPQGMAGRFGASIGEGFGNPATYVGPGGLPLKIGGSILSSILGQAGEESGLPGGRLVGSLAGGIVAAKTLGPKQATAAVPTAAELKASGQAGYKTALDSGLEVKPGAVSDFGTQVQQELIGQGFAPELAPKTFKFLDTIQRPTAGATTTAANLDAMRKYLGRVAQETQPANGGMVKPTADAAAATAVLDRFKGFTEDLPAGSVMAGNPDAYAGAIKTANADYAASQRAALVNDKMVKAELRAAAANSGQNVANTIRQRMVDILANPKLQRGFSADELAQMNRVVRGTMFGNATRFAGNMMGGGGGIGSAISAGLGAAAAGPAGAFAPAIGYGLRKLSEASTLRNAAALEKMIRQRSPLYQNRLNALSTTSMLPNQAQILRGGLLGLR